MLKRNQLFIVAPVHLEEGVDPAVAVLKSQMVTARPPTTVGLLVGLRVTGVRAVGFVVPPDVVGFLDVGLIVGMPGLLVHGPF